MLRQASAAKRSKRREGRTVLVQTLDLQEPARKRRMPERFSACDVRNADFENFWDGLDQSQWNHGEGHGSPSKRPKAVSSKYFGVRYRPDLSKWVAEIRVAEWKEVDKKVWLGTLDTEEGAARAVDSARKILKCRKKRPFNFPCEKLSAYSVQLPYDLTDLNSDTIKKVTEFVKKKSREYAAEFESKPDGCSTEISIFKDDNLIYGCLVNIGPDQVNTKIMYNTPLASEPPSPERVKLAHQELASSYPLFFVNGRQTECIISMCSSSTDVLQTNELLWPAQALSKQGQELNLFNFDQDVLFVDQLQLASDTLQHCGQLAVEAASSDSIMEDWWQLLESTMNIDHMGFNAFFSENVHALEDIDKQQNETSYGNWTL